MNTFDIETEINGCIQWIREHRDEGWIAYYVNFMFEPLQGNTAGILEQMKDAIHCEFYIPFMTAFVRDPHRKREQEWLPRFRLYPDRPVLKRGKLSIREIGINDDGLHYNGFMLIPPVSRFQGDPVEHIQNNQSLYTRGRIDRIHAVYMDDNLARVADYAAKTVKRGRADLDDVLMLPKSLSEVKPTNPVLTAEQRAIKDIVSAHNVSEEYARQMHADRLRVG